ncbi:hypothetical protein AQEC111735_03820 [Aquirufa ecclesiirivi]
MVVHVPQYLNQHPRTLHQVGQAWCIPKIVVEKNKYQF